MRTREEVLPICGAVSAVPKRIRERSATHQEDNGDVEQESDQGVAKERESADAVDIGHGQAGEFAEQTDNTVHDGAGRGVVVQRNKRVHLELGGAEQTLDHDEAHGLENDTAGLVEETDHVELDFTERGNDDTDDDERDVAEGLHVRGRNTERPGSEQHGDRGRGLVLAVRIRVVQSGAPRPTLSI